MQQPLVVDGRRRRSIRKVTQELLRYAGPFVPANILINVGFTFNGMLLSRGGDEALAALSFINAYNAIMDAASFTFFGTGAACAHALGEGEEGRIREIGKQSLLIGAGITIPISMLYYTGSSIAHLLGASPQATQNIKDYCFASGWGFAPIAFIATFTQMSTPYGTMPIAVSLTCSTALTCGLSYAFATGRFGLPPMPYAGPGLGSSLATVFAAMGFGIFLKRHPRYCGIWVGTQQPNASKKILKNILSIGLPSTLNALSQLAANIGGTMLTSRYIGTMGSAQQGLVGLPNGYLQTFMACTADAGTIVIARRYGKRDFSSLNRYLNISIGLNLASGIIGLGIIAGGSAFYIESFADPSLLDTQFIQTAQNLILISCGAQLASSVGNICIGSLRGIGDTWRPMILNLTLKVGLNLTLGYLLTTHSDLGVYSPYVADLITSTLLYSPLLYTYANNQLSPPKLEERSKVSTPEEDHSEGNRGRFCGWCYPKYRKSSVRSVTPTVTSAMPDTQESSRRSRWPSCAIL